MSKTRNATAHNSILTTMTKRGRKRRAVSRLLWDSIKLVLLLVALATSICAQSGTPNANPSMGFPNSLSASSLSGLENFSPFTGKMNFVLPLLPINGRGSAGYTITLPISNQLEAKVHYFSNNHNHMYATLLRPEALSQIAYSPGHMTTTVFTGPSVTCFYPPPNPNNEFYTDYYRAWAFKFILPDGSSVVLRDELHDGDLLPPANCNNNPVPDRGTIFKSRDGSGITFITDTNFSHSGKLIFSDGTVYQIDQNGMVTSIRDRNGNTVTFSYEQYSYVYDPGLNLSSSWWRTKTIEDSLSREVSIDYDVQEASYGNCDKINFKDFGGTQFSTVRVCKTNLGSSLRESGAVPQTYEQLFPGLLQGQFLPDFEQGTLDPTVISSVWLPNGRRYQFFYNVYTDLSRVVNPSGGAIEYDWAAGMTGLPVQGEASWSDTYRRMVERRTYPDGITLESKTRYSRPESVSSVSGSFGTFYRYGATAGHVDIDQIDPNSDAIITRERHYYVGHVADTSPVYPIFKWGKELQVDTFGAGGTNLLRQVTYEWRQRAPVNWTWTQYAGSGDSQIESDPRMVETITTLVEVNSTTLVTKQSAINPINQTVAFDQYNNQTDSWEYDFGVGAPGALRRHSRTEFVTDSAYTSPPSSGGTNLLRLPYKTQVYEIDPNTGAESLLSYSEFIYDESAYTADPYSPVPTGWIDPGALRRGNLTTVKRWLNFDGSNLVAFPDGTYITTHAKYDQVGNVVSAYDAKGKQTQIAYSSQYKYGYPTSTISADPDGGGSLTALTGSSEYDLSTGLVTATVDANGIRTVFTYDDPLRRLTQVTRAVDDASLKNQTTYDYDDDALSLTVTSDLNAFNDNALKGVTLYDGFGRAKETRAYETSSNYIVTKQEFDALGRIKRTYNPYRTTTDETYGWSQPTYDALGRVGRVETFDVNGTSTGFVTTDYWGNRVLASDQTGRKRIGETNALGQLTDVWEITTGAGTVAVSFGTQSFAGYVTHYDYDGLNNLIKVTQGQQQRTFIYDSLTRLLSATNPESGTIGYRYDENGNLSQKIDPRLLSGTDHLVVSYEYDALNRLKTRNYNDGTPNVTYNYDSAGANSKGRLTSVSTTLSSYTYGSYDVLGRAASGTQTTNGVSYLMTYEYDLAGHMTRQSYPSGRIVVTETDGAGRIAGVKNGLTGAYYAGATPTDGSNRIQYSAHGGTKALKLGNGLWEHSSFNSRLQLTQIGLGSAATNSSVLQLDYGYYSDGNVQSHSITAPGLALAQSYQYDDLNRLKVAQESAGTSQTWKQTFIYDRFGNRNFDTEAEHTTIPTPLVNAVISPANNRIDPSAPGQSLIDYDTAGNLKREMTGEAYGYDGEGRLTTYNGGDPVTGGSTYVYDGDGRRVEKITPSGTTIFVYNIFGQLVAEYGNPQSSGSGTSYLTSDRLGSPRVITDSSGNVRARHDYLPFGEELSGLGNRTSQNGYVGDGIRQKFTQYERDAETGLDFAQARHYSFVNGRFTRPDPLLASANPGEPQSWNRYVYCANNPLNYVDPNGLDWWYAKGTNPAEPEWFDKDPGKGYERWYNVSSYVYYSNESKVWWALNPKKNEAKSFSTRSAAEAAYKGYSEPSSQESSLTQGQVEFMGGFNSGLSPLMPVIDLVNASGGMDITSRDYGIGKALGFAVGTGLTLGVSGTIQAAEEGASLTLTEEVGSTFANSSYRTITLKSDVAAYRYSGGTTDPVGRFLTTRQTVGRISSPGDAQRMLNLPAGNTAETLNVFIIPKGTTIFVGRVAGGGQRATQIFIKNPSVLGGP